MELITFASHSPPNLEDLPHGFSQIALRPDVLNGRFISHPNARVAAQLKWSKAGGKVS